MVRYFKEQQKYMSAIGGGQISKEVALGMPKNPGDR
jgi:hypothetical protein